MKADVDTHAELQGYARTIASGAAHAAVAPVDAAFVWLRKNAPLARAELDGFPPFWIVTRHADISEISRQSALFSSERRPMSLIPSSMEALIRRRTGGAPYLLRTLLQMDPPDHLEHRALVQARFTNNTLQALRERLQALARAEVQALIDADGSCDFAATAAVNYPFAAIMELLGVPEHERATMRQLVNLTLAPADGSNNLALSGATLESKASIVDHALAEMFESVAAYFADYSETARARVENNLTSVLANATLRGEPLTHSTAASYFILLVLAGFETTAFSIATGMQILSEHPELLRRLRAAPELIRNFVEECVRWATPSRHFMRTATADTTLRGQHIAENDWLMLCYPSANRDEEIFEAPFEFRIDRPSNPHLGFGHGAHKCLGLRLARLEMETFWQALLPRLHAVEAAGPAVRSRSVLVSGVKNLPVRCQFV